MLTIPEIAQALELSEAAAYTPQELDLYESYWDQISREKTLIMDRYITGKVEGRAEGRAEGIAEGKVEEKYGIARNLLKKGSDIDFVVECTGLTRDIVQKILESK